LNEAGAGRNAKGRRAVLGHLVPPGPNEAVIAARAVPRHFGRRLIARLLSVLFPRHTRA
jgi:hypothetical protein